MQTNQANKNTCIYCGATQSMTKEHIIPKALGGVPTIKRVCKECNNNILSSLDKELASHSILSFASSRHLQKKHNYLWDIDHKENNRLLEAEAFDGSLNSLRLWPQLIITNSGPAFYGNSEELSSVGRRRCLKTFCEKLQGAFAKYKKREKRPPFILERIKYISPGYSLPPRVFARQRIDKINDKTTFIARFHDENDKESLLDYLHNFDPDERFVGPERTFLANEQFNLAAHFEAMAVIRALVKIGINLLARYCSKTEISSSTFRQAVMFVTQGCARNPIRVHNRCGFVHPSELRKLHKTDCHKFRLVHYKMAELWELYFSFYGGKVCGRVEFQGKNEEAWESIDITVPIGSNKWKVRRYKDHRPLRVSPDWENLLVVGIPASTPAEVVTRKSFYSIPLRRGR